MYFVPILTVLQDPFRAGRLLPHLLILHISVQLPVWRLCLVCFEGLLRRQAARLLHSYNAVLAASAPGLVVPAWSCWIIF